MFNIVYFGKLSKNNSLKLFIQQTYLVHLCEHSVGKRTHQGHHNFFFVFTIILHSERQHRRRSLCYKYVKNKNVKSSINMINRKLLHWPWKMKVIGTQLLLFCQYMLSHRYGSRNLQKVKLHLVLCMFLKQKVKKNE